MIKQNRLVLVKLTEIKKIAEDYSELLSKYNNLRIRKLDDYGVISRSDLLIIKNNLEQLYTNFQQLKRELGDLGYKFDVTLEKFTDFEKDRELGVRLWDDPEPQSQNVSMEVMPDGKPIGFEDFPDPEVFPSGSKRKVPLGLDYIDNLPSVDESEPIELFDKKRGEERVWWDQIRKLK